MAEVVSDHRSRASIYWILLRFHKHWRNISWVKWQCILSTKNMNFKLLRFYDINSSSCSVAFIVYFVCSRRRVIRHCCFCQVGRLCVRETPRAVCEQWPNIWAGAPWSNIWYESPCALPNICFILRLCLEWQHIDRENRLFALTSWASLLPIVRHCWPVCCN